MELLWCTTASAEKDQKSHRRNPVENIGPTFTNWYDFMWQGTGQNTVLFHFAVQQFYFVVILVFFLKKTKFSTTLFFIKLN